MQNFSITWKNLLPLASGSSLNPGSIYVKSIADIFDSNPNAIDRYWYKQAYSLNLNNGIGTPSYDYLLLKATQQVGAANSNEQQILIRGSTNFAELEVMYAPNGGIGITDNDLKGMPGTIASGKAHTNFRSFTGTASSSNTSFPGRLTQNSKLIRVAEHRDQITSYNSEAWSSLTILLTDSDDFFHLLGIQAGRIMIPLYADNTPGTGITGDGIFAGSPDNWLKLPTFVNSSKTSCMLVNNSWYNLYQIRDLELNTNNGFLQNSEGYDKPFPVNLLGFKFLNSSVQEHIGPMGYTKFFRFFRENVPHKSLLISKITPASGNNLERQAWISCNASNPTSSNLKNKVILWSINPNSI